MTIGRVSRGTLHPSTSLPRKGHARLQSANPEQIFVKGEVSKVNGKEGQRKPKWSTTDLRQAQGRRLNPLQNITLIAAEICYVVLCLYILSSSSQCLYSFAKRRVFIYSSRFLVCLNLGSRKKSIGVS